MTTSTLYTIVCKAPGCGKEGPADLIVDHTDGRLLIVCPRCRSKNVKVLAINAQQGERLGRVRLVARLVRGGVDAS